MSALYDRIGRSYVATREEDPRIAAAIHAALGDARTVLNVGAGSGSYEPRDREVTAVEPSGVMRAQRPPDAAPCIDARAEALPFEDGSFDATMAVLSDHHWVDRLGGLRELRRVGRRAVVFQWDPAFADAFWLARDYLHSFPGRKRSRSRRPRPRSAPRSSCPSRSHTTAATAS
jgi:SAM-dependent methyltransferase